MPLEIKKRAPRTNRVAEMIFTVGVPEDTGRAILERANQTSKRRGEVIRDVLVREFGKAEQRATA